MPVPHARVASCRNAVDRAYPRLGVQPEVMLSISNGSGIRSHSTPDRDLEVCPVRAVRRTVIEGRAGAVLHGDCLLSGVLLGHSARVWCTVLAPSGARAEALPSDL